MALTLYQQQRKLAFEVLGVPLDSPEKRIRRAYRERVVMVHRSHLLDLQNHLESLKWAYDKARAPALLRYAPAPEPVVELEKIRRHGTLLAELARQREALVSKASEEAIATNASMMKELADEYDRRNREDAAISRRKRLIERIVKWTLLVIFFAILIAITLRVL